MNLIHPARKISFAAITLALSLGAAAVSQAATNLILNGDFSANASDYTTAPGYNGAPNPNTPSDWSAGAGGVGSSGSPFAPSSLDIDGNASDTVTDFAFLQKYYASVSQSFDVTAGQEYELTYVAGARSSDSAGDEIVATISYNSDPTDSLVSTTNLLSSSDFTSFSDSFVATSSGEVTLTFSPAKVGVPPTDYTTDFTADVSNVAVEAVGSVPEPSAWAMLGAGVVVLLGFLRFRRSA